MLWSVSHNHGCFWLHKRHEEALNMNYHWQEKANGRLHGSETRANRSWPFQSACMELKSIWFFSGLGQGHSLMWNWRPPWSVTLWISLSHLFTPPTLVASFKRCDFGTPKRSPKRGGSRWWQTTFWKATGYFQASFLCFFLLKEKKNFKRIMLERRLHEKKTVACRVIFNYWKIFLPPSFPQPTHEFKSHTNVEGEKNLLVLLFGCLLNCKIIHLKQQGTDPQVGHPLQVLCINPDTTTVRGNCNRGVAGGTRVMVV